MPLDVMTVRAAKPGSKTRKLSDSRGLYLELAPAGGKWWRWKYYFNKVEKRLSLGTFPDVSLAQAREDRDAARKLLKSGVDPSQERKARKAAGATHAANSFEVIAREWFALKSPAWEATYADGIIARLQADVFPWIGDKPIAEVSAPELLAVLRRIEKRGAHETAHRAKGNLGQIFRYSIVTARCERDPAADLRGALAPVQTTNHAAVTEPAELGKILRMLDNYNGTNVVLAALRLAPLLFVRPGELRQAEWKDFDLEKAQWAFFVTKTKTSHIVPLATQAVAILRELHRTTGTGLFVFPGARSDKRPMSENAVIAALVNLGLKDVMTGHGFRATARTILDEVLGYPVDVIEHQLAHTVRDPNGTAYNRTKHLPQRHKMMQHWADYLDELRGSS